MGHSNLNCYNQIHLNLLQSEAVETLKHCSCVLALSWPNHQVLLPNRSLRMRGNLNRELPKQICDFLIFSGQAEGSQIQSCTFDKETNTLHMETSVRRCEATLSADGRRMEGVSAFKLYSWSKTFYATYVRWQ